MQNYWNERLNQANVESRRAPPELRHIYETLATHYRKLERQCRPLVSYRSADNALANDRFEA